MSELQSKRIYAGIDVEDVLTNTGNEAFNAAVRELFQNPPEGRDPLDIAVGGLLGRQPTHIELRVPDSVLDYIQQQEANSRQGKPFINIEAALNLMILDLLKKQGTPATMPGWKPEHMEPEQDVLERIQDVQAHWFPSVNTIPSDQRMTNMDDADIRYVTERSELSGDDMLLRVLFVLETDSEIAVARVMSQQMSGGKFVRPLTALIGCPISEMDLLKKQSRDWFSSYARQAARFFSDSLARDGQIPVELIQRRIEQALRQYEFNNVVSGPQEEPYPGCFGMPSRNCVIRVQVDEWWKNLISLTPMHEQYSELSWVPKKMAKDIFLDFPGFRARNQVAPGFQIDAATTALLRALQQAEMPPVPIQLTREDHTSA